MNRTLRSLFDGHVSGHPQHAPIGILFISGDLFIRDIMLTFLDVGGAGRRIRVIFTQPSYLLGRFPHRITRLSPHGRGGSGVLTEFFIIIRKRRNMHVFLIRLRCAK